MFLKLLLNCELPESRLQCFFVLRDKNKNMISWKTIGYYWLVNAVRVCTFLLSSHWPLLFPTVNHYRYESEVYYNQFVSICYHFYKKQNIFSKLLGLRDSDIEWSLSVWSVRGRQTIRNAKFTLFVSFLFLHIHLYYTQIIEVIALISTHVTCLIIKLNLL